jgi:hypothetical protein
MNFAFMLAIITFAWALSFLLLCNHMEGFGGDEHGVVWTCAEHIQVHTFFAASMVQFIYL